MLQIEQILTLSTAHIKESTAKKLDIEPDNDNLCLSVYKKANFGYYIIITDNIEYDLLPEELANLIRFTKDHNCNILCLDCDAKIVPYLPTYNW